MSRATKTLALLTLLLAAVPTLAGAQPVGSEFVVNQRARGYHGQSSLTIDDSGKFVVAWVDRREGTLVATLRRFGPDGRALGGDVRVGPDASGFQVNPFVSSRPAGGFVVLWVDDTGIRGRWFDAAGAALGDELEVVSDLNSRWPVAAIASDGSLATAWNRAGVTDLENVDLLARRFGPASEALARQARIDIGGRFDYLDTAICAHPRGEVVAWTEAAEPPYGDANPMARLLGPLGKPVGSEFGLATHVAGFQELVGLACGRDGSFTAFWHGDTSDGQPHGLAGQRFDTEGAPAGPELLLNAGREGARVQWTDVVAIGPSGELLVAWAVPDERGWPSAIQGHWFDPTGAPYGEAFPISESSGAIQLDLRIAASSSGSFVVLWSKRDGRGEDLFGRRLETPFPPLLSISDAIVVEGNRGTRVARFTVSLSAPRQVSVRARFQTVEATATPGADYSSTSGVVRIAAGQTSAVIKVEILGDRLIEGAEAFTVRLSDPKGVLLGTAEARGTITDDDGAARHLQ